MENKPIKVIYIAGSSRSGSTLFERILRQTGLFADIGELRYLWLKDFDLPYLCGCGELISQCTFWQPVIKEAFQKQNPVSFLDMQRLRVTVDRFRRIPHLLNLWISKHFQQQVNQYKQGLIQLYQAVQNVSGKEFILDSSKDISTLIVLLQMPEIELYVIHLVRDSRAVAYSWRRKKYRRERVDNHEYLPVYPEYKIAAWWLTYQVILKNLLTNQVRNRLIKYEDLIQSPQNVVSSVLTDLNKPDIDLNFINNDIINDVHEGHGISGNPNRFDKGEIKLSLDTEWREKMTPFKKYLVSLITLPGLMHYGYLKHNLKKTSDNPKKFI